MGTVFRRPDRTTNQAEQKKTAMRLLVCVVLFVLGILGAIIFRSWPIKVLFVVIALLAAFTFRRYSPQGETRETRAFKTPSKKPTPLPAEDLKPDAPEDPGTESGKEEATPALHVEEDTVFVSERGTKFHKAIDCTGLKFAEFTEKMPRSEALAKGKTPCKLCHTDKI